MDDQRAAMEHPIHRELTHYQYLRARLEQAFPDADGETVADILKVESNTPELFPEGGINSYRHANYLIVSWLNHWNCKFMQCSASLSSVCSRFGHLPFQATCSL